MTDRIDNIGGVETVEIAGGRRIKAPSVVINRDTQQYVRNLRGERVYGPKQIIEGTISALHPYELLVIIRDLEGNKIKVHVTPRDFERIRYAPDLESIVSCTGKPIYYLGQSEPRVSEFEATSIRLVDQVD
jgi:hypothetical protein